jgi:hypothetical protein
MHPKHIVQFATVSLLESSGLSYMEEFSTVRNALLLIFALQYLMILIEQDKSGWAACCPGNLCPELLADTVAWR